MRAKLLTLLLCVSAFSLIHIGAKGIDYPKYNVTQITSLNGLPHSDARIVSQCPRGYIWIATNDGLCKYDGDRLYTYKRGERNLTCGLIRSIAHDEEGNVWVGAGEKGVFILDYKKDIFTRLKDYFNESEYEIFDLAQSIEIDKLGNIWVTNYRNYIYKIYKTSNKYDIKRYNLQSSTTIRLDNKKNLIATTSDRVYIYDQSSDDFITYINFPNITEVQWYDSEIYVTQDNKLFSYSEFDNQLQAIQSNINIETLFISSDKTFWIRNNDGIFAGKLKGNKLKNEIIIDENIYTTNTIEDSFGNIWYGSYRKWMYKISKNTKPFIHIPLDCSTEALCEDSKERLWIGTSDGRILRYNNELTHCELIYKTETTPNVIHYIAQNPQNDQIYICSRDNIIILNEGGKKQGTIKLEGTTFLKFDGQYLWICSYDDGLILYNTITKRIEANYTIKNGLPSNIVRSVYINEKSDDLWIATASGLAILKNEDKFSTISKEKKLFTTKLLGSHIIEVKQFSDSDIAYMTTIGEGIYTANASEIFSSDCKFSNITSENGLLSNTVKGVIKDTENNLWIPTLSGLNRLNINNNTIYSYGYNDGLRVTDYADISNILKSNGEIILGGTEGFTVFDPSNIQENKLSPTTIINELQVLNNSIQVGDTLNNNIILNESLHSGQTIRLDYNSNSFSLFFSLLQFTNSQGNRFKYKLYGYDTDWNEVNTGNYIAKYSWVDPGNYKFEVYGCNNDNLWSEPYTLYFEIEYPWWRSIYAYIIYFILLIFILFLLYKFIKNRQALIKQTIISNQEKIYLQKLNQSRMKFFSNISHELRTPLTLIISALKIIRAEKQSIVNSQENDNNEQARALNIAISNSQVLLRFVNQILTLARNDQNRLKPKLNKLNISNIVKDNSDQFIYLAKEKEIDIILYGCDNPIYIDLDKEMTEEILYNLLSNAIKHTPVGGEVSCEVTENADNIEIRISDSGSGIEESIKEHIFDRFFTQGSKHSNQSGTGIGLSLTKHLIELLGGNITFNSSATNGTTFIVKFNINNRYEDIAEQSTEQDFLNQESTKTNDIDSKEINNSPINSEEYSDNSTTKSTILIIDDNLEILEILQMFLKPYYKIIVTTNGKDGWKLCRKVLPTLIITDMVMPGVSGSDFCQTVKSNPLTSHIPVIMMTAENNEHGLKESYSALADSYITKPFDNDVLLLTIKSLIENRRKITQKYINKNFTENSTEIGSIVQNVVEIIDKDLSNEDLSVEFIANKLKTNQISLNKRLKEEINITCNTLIRQVRLRRAAELLSSQKHSIKEVTYMVGFNDLRYFRACFKKEFNVLPSEYSGSPNETPDDNDNNEIVEE